MSRFLQGQDSDSFAWVYPNPVETRMRQWKNWAWCVGLNLSSFACVGFAGYYVAYSNQSKEVKDIVTREIKLVMPVINQFIGWISTLLLKSE